jgi:hypothetical protein
VRFATTVPHTSRAWRLPLRRPNVGAERGHLAVRAPEELRRPEGQDVLPGWMFRAHRTDSGGGGGSVTKTSSKRRNRRKYFARCLTGTGDVTKPGEGSMT